MHHHADPAHRAEQRKARGDAAAEITLKQSSDEIQRHAVIQLAFARQAFGEFQGEFLHA